MKQLVFALAVLLSLGASAQQKALETAKIKTPTVQCEMCKNRIETYLKRYDGVTFVQVNYKKKETTVKYLTDRTNLEEIKTAIANAGYDADDIPATPDAYNRLPQCCKKPENGGDGKGKQ
ncbi:MAG TPA: heavy-metal-associated domain-containing protein [Chitinophagaceae bacterium]|nr:heavy-metal-associated domain-containing protein [Chitinophagaceae bacterium]